MNRQRRTAIARMGLVLATSVFWSAKPAHAASDWPAKPIKLVVPFAAGSGSDNMARVVADALQQALHVPVVIDNKPGASGQLGAAVIAKSPPDGYTLGVTGASSNSSAPWLAKSLPYDPVRDFEHIAGLVSIPMVLVVPEGSPDKSMEDLVRRAQQAPGKLNYGYGSGSQQAVAGAFCSLTKVEALPVPFKAVPQVVTDLIGGQLDFAWLDASIAGPQVRGGKLRALAVSSATRVPLLPKVPTLHERGIGDFDLAIWVGIGAPRGTPPEVVQRVAGAMRKASVDPAYMQKLEAQGFEVRFVEGPAHAQYVDQQLKSWGTRIREAGIQPE